MINRSTIQAILNFYLENKVRNWGMINGDNITLPKDPKASNKVSFLCSLNHSLPHIINNKEELLRLCDRIADQEKKEQSTHRSSRFFGLAAKFTGYPFMTCSLRAIRSYIMSELSDAYKDKSIKRINEEIAELEIKLRTERTPANEQALAAKKQDREMLALMNYHRGEFLHVIKYEDSSSDTKRFQQIERFEEFLEAYNNPKSVALLDKIYQAWHKETLLVPTDILSSQKVLNEKTPSAHTGMFAAQPSTRKLTKAEKKELRRALHEEREQEKQAVGFRR